MKQAVVTGGTRGIGLAIGARLAAEGYRVVAAARRPAALPEGVRFVGCDVADAGSVAALFGGLGRVDALVCCAGLAGANRLDAADDALWDAIVATNLRGTYLCCRAALPLLPDGSGRIVAIASVLGLRGVADQTAYCAAKHGVVGLVRALAQAVAARGITVNAVCPGWVETEMAAQRFAELGITAAEAAAGVPTGRLTPAGEIAGMVAYLVGKDAGSITGEALVVDGGRMAAA